MSSPSDPTGEARTVLPARRQAGNPPAQHPSKPIAVDEMLEQLRTPESGNRRRRTQQPIYAQRRRRRRLILICGAVATLVLGGWYGYRLFQKIRLEGETFRAALNGRLSDAVGCQVTLTRIYDGGAGSLSAQSASFDTKDQDLIAEGSFSELSASLTASSWVSNEWGVEMLSIQTGRILLDPNRPVIPNDSTNWVPRKAGAASDDSGFRFGISPEPKVITMDRLRFTKSVSIEWPSHAPDRKLEGLVGMRGNLRFPRPGLIEGSFADGTIMLAQLPEMKLEHLEWRLTGRRLEIPGGRIGFGLGNARAEITGEANLVRDGSIDLKVNFVDAPLKAMVSQVWYERVMGTFSAPAAVLHADFGKGTERSLEGDFTLSAALFRGLSLVNKLADILQRPEYTLLEFPAVKGHFKWSPSGGLEVTELMADRDGMVRLEGGFTLSSDDKMGGRLTVSVSDAALNGRIRQVPHPFSRGSDGWWSTEVMLSGTSATINDSLESPGAPSLPKVLGVSDGEAVNPPPQQRNPGSPEVRKPSAEDLEKKFNDLLK